MGIPGWMAQMLHGEVSGLWFVAAFAGGLALNLTPCVYPMIPVTLAFFSGQAKGRAGRTACLGAIYVVGISITYAVLGVVASQTGALLGSWLQHPAVIIGIILLIAALALSLFGFYDLRPPAWFVQRFGRASSGLVGALVMGLTVGLIASPCIGPFVLGMLLFVSELANPWFGFALLFIMGVGMGLPYILLGLFADRLAHLPKAGAWLVWSKKVLGVILLGLILYFVRLLLPPFWVRWLVVGWLLAGGVYLGWVERSRLRRLGTWGRRLVGAAFLVVAVAMVPRQASGPGTAGGRMAWQPYSAVRLEQAQRDGRPAVVDVFADWCLPCMELDHTTFRDPEVVDRLSAVVTLRVDATGEVSPEGQALLDAHHIYGVPTVLLFDAYGRERADLRVEGFVTPKAFAKRLEALRAPAPDDQR